MIRQHLNHLPTSLSIFLTLPSSAAFGRSGDAEQFSEELKLTALQHRASSFGNAWQKVLQSVPAFPNLRELEIRNASFQANVVQHLAHCPSLRKLTFISCELKPLNQTTLDPFSFSLIEELVFDSVRTSNLPLRCVPVENVHSPLHPLALANALSHRLLTLRINPESHFSGDILKDLTLPHFETIELLPGPMGCSDIHTILNFLESCPSLKHLHVGELTLRAPYSRSPVDQVALRNLHSYTGGLSLAAFILPDSMLEEVHIKPHRGFINVPELNRNGPSAIMCQVKPWIVSLKALRHLSFTLSDWDDDVVLSLASEVRGIISLSLRFQTGVPCRVSYHCYISHPLFLTQNIGNVTGHWVYNVKTVSGGAKHRYHATKP